MQDALKAEADQTMERLKDDLSQGEYRLRRHGPERSQHGQTADTIQINIKGVNAQKTSAFRTLVNDHYPTWTLRPVNSTDYKMNLKASELLALKRETVEREIQTITNRINNLGLTEPVVQQHGQPLTPSTRFWCNCLAWTIRRV